MFVHELNHKLVKLLALFVFITQFAALVHATDHPFHQDDIVCASYHNAEQNKYLINESPLQASVDLFAVTASLPAAKSLIPSQHQYYLQRAPPYQF